jgi:PAS domain S-box-containing protein
MATLYSLLPLLAIAANLLVGSYVITRAPRRLANRLFGCVTLCLSLWGVGEFMMRTATSPSEALEAGKIGSLGWCLVGVFFFHLTLELAAVKPGVRRWLPLAAAYSTGLALVLLTWTTDLIFKPFVPSTYPGYMEVGGLLRLPSKLFVAGMMLTGIAVLVHSYRRTASLENRRRLGLVIVAAAIPVAMGLVTDLLLPLAGVETPFSSLSAGPIMAAITAYAVTRHDLMRSVVSSLGGTIITKIHEAVLVADGRGLIETANPAAERLTGYSEAELVNSPVAALLMTIPSTSRHEPERSACVTKDGELVPVEMSQETVKRRTGGTIGSVIVLHDLTETLRLVAARREAQLATAQARIERKRTEALSRSRQELKELSEFLESVIGNIAEPLFIKDRDLRFVYVNKALCDISGYTREQLIGKKSADFVPEDVAANAEKIEMEILSGGEMVEDTVEGVQDARGKALHLRMIKAPIKDESGQVEHLVGIANDITEQKQLEKTRLDFIRVAAHELRTPLSSLQLGLDVLARETRGALDREQQRSLEILSLSVDRLTRLARNLLDVASLEAGALTLERKRVRIGSLVDEAVAVFSSTMNEKGLYCRVLLEEALPPAHADTNRLSQVLFNLLSNAVKFTDEGGITISAREDGDGYLELCVSDTGPGVSAARSETIFSGFVSARDAVTAAEGTGLGLSIARAIVEAHGGRIWLESSHGEGSEFHFTVPVAPGLKDPARG